jgi:hypothetical protein
MVAGRDESSRPGMRRLVPLREPKPLLRRLRRMRFLRHLRTALKPVHLPLLVVALGMFALAARAAGIELMFRYNTHHLIKPSRVNPRIHMPQRTVPILRA